MDTNTQPPDRSPLKYAILIAVTLAVIVCIIIFMWRSRPPEELSPEQRIGSNTKGCHAPELDAGFSMASRPDITPRLNLINGDIDPVRISVLKSQEYRRFSAATQAALGGGYGFAFAGMTTGFTRSRSLRGRQEALRPATTLRAFRSADFI